MRITTNDDEKYPARISSKGSNVVLNPLQCCGLVPKSYVILAYSRHHQFIISPTLTPLPPPSASPILRPPSWATSAPALPGASSMPRVRKPEGPTLCPRKGIPLMIDLPVVDGHYNDLVGHPEVRSIPRKDKVSFLNFLQIFGICETLVLPGSATY